MLQQKDRLPVANWSKFCLFVVLSLSVWQLGVEPARANTWTICKSISNPCDFSSVQAAINASSEDDILEFTPENSANEIYIETITINKSLTFLGQTTIIDAQNGGTAVTIIGSPTVVMQNMIIQNGMVANGNGGGIRLNGGNLTLTNVTLGGNDVTGNGTSTGLGGGLYIASSGSEVQLTDDVIIQMGTAVSGGAIYNNGTLTADNLELVLNYATNGAGIYNNGTAILDGQTSIRQNGSTDSQTTQSGGGIYNTASATSALLNLDITSNKAQNGAGIYNLGSLQVINANVGSDNIAALAGGGLYNNGTTTLINSTVVQNEADTGAGIYNEDTLTVNNSTLSRNTGPDNQYNANGPGLYNQSGAAVLNNVTIHLTNGTSIFANGGTVDVGNTIISSASEPACGGGGAFTSNGYNLANDQSCTFLTAAGDLQDLDPQLNSITPPGDGSTYHSPKLTSPVIDAGNPANPGSSGMACLASDQRGLARPQSTRCDIGAVEIVVYRIYTPVVIK